MTPIVDLSWEDVGVPRDDTEYVTMQRLAEMCGLGTSSHGLIRYIKGQGTKLDVEIIRIFSGGNWCKAISKADAIKVLRLRHEQGYRDRAVGKDE